jgi:ligand-binding SRPBCC domain-containing protein
MPGWFGRERWARTRQSLREISVVPNYEDETKMPRGAEGRRADSRIFIKLASRGTWLMARTGGGSGEIRPISLRTPVQSFLLQREQTIPRPIEAVFAFFADAKNLEAITPPWLAFRILTPGPVSMGEGARIFYRLRWHGIPLRWLTEIRRWNPPVAFIDEQLQGPYQLWHHAHQFESVPGGTRMRDVVQYALPFGLLGRVAHAAWVRRDLQTIFDYRACKVSDLLS